MKHLKNRSCPTEAKKNQILEMLGDEIPDNFDIKVTPKT
jgi:hypothetical protein